MHHKAVIADSEWRTTGREVTIETTLQRGLVSRSCPWLGVRLVPLRDLTQIVPDIVLCVSVGAESNKIGRFETGAHEDAVCMMCNDMS